MDWKSVITVAKSDNWQGLYLDGDLIIEDKVIGIRDVVILVNATQEYDGRMLDFEYKELLCDDEWLEKTGRFPKKLGDVVYKTQK